MFLRKNTSLGRNLERAAAYRRSHEHFVSVAQNTYTNAEKLLTAADELARWGNGRWRPSRPGLQHKILDMCYTMWAMKYGL